LCGSVGPHTGQRQATNSDGHFPRDGQHLPAGSEYGNAHTGGQDGMNKLCDRFNKVLTVVQNHEQTPVPEVVA